MSNRRNKSSSILDKHNLQMVEVEPLTRNQLRAFESEKHLMLHGMAGTGKTFISLYLAMDDINRNLYSHVAIIRSAVPTRDMGFLPGGEKEKASVYEEPYKNIYQELFSRGDAYEVQKKSGIVHFMTTSFIRGLTLKNAVIIVDECQNMSMHELDSIVTRVGENCRIIFCGDFRQSDFTKPTEKKGLQDFMDILKHTDMFDMIEFEIDDIVRSEFVKRYLICKDNKERGYYD